jgi:aminoglycoside phosphotransferase (APT) family kinase protein
MDFAEGRIFRDPSLPGIPPAERREIYAAMGEVMARLHAVDWRAAGLDNFGKPTGYLARQISLWTRQYEAAKTHAIPAMDELIRWLPAHTPAGETTTIAHGDFRLENLMYHPTEPRVIGVLDWELATLGHPLADVAYNCMIWHLDPATPNLSGLAGRDLAAMGIPSEAEYLAGYAASARLRVDRPRRLCARTRRQRQRAERASGRPARRSACRARLEGRADRSPQ